jgi:hypothetical protein
MSNASMNCSTYALRFSQSISLSAGTVSNGFRFDWNRRIKAFPAHENAQYGRHTWFFPHKYRIAHSFNSGFVIYFDLGRGPQNEPKRREIDHGSSEKESNGQRR